MMIMIVAMIIMIIMMVMLMKKMTKKHTIIVKFELEIAILGTITL